MLSSIRVRTFKMYPNSIGYLGPQTRNDHGNMGQYKCFDCGTAFTRKDNLSRHQLKHPSSSLHEVSDRSTDDESKSVSNKSSGNDSESGCSQSDETCTGEKDTGTDSEMDAETDAATDEKTDGETDEDSSGDEYDRAYDDDNRSTMRRMLRTTRRFIRVASEILMKDDTEKASMDYKSSDVDQDDDNQENGMIPIGPLDVLQLLKKEIRKARRGE